MAEPAQPEAAGTATGTATAGTGRGAGRLRWSTVRRAAPAVGRIGVGLLVPSALYYLLRAFGASIYLALVVSTVLSTLPSLWALVRRRQVDALSTYVTAMTVGGLVVTLVPGSTRFLLARESVMTGVTGVWFLTSLRAARPLAYRFTKPLMEGRFRWPDRWDELWPRSPRFRRMWRTSSILFGGGTLLDAALRVVFAYTLPPDVVPALGLVLTVVTLLGVNVVVGFHYARSGVYDPGSPLRRGLDDEPPPG